MSVFPFLSFQASAYASDDGILTERMIDIIVNNTIRQHHQKVLWQHDDSGSSAAFLEPQDVSIPVDSESKPTSSSETSPSSSESISKSPSVPS